MMPSLNKDYFFFFVTRASSTVSKTISLFDSSALDFLFLMLTLIKQISARKLKHYEEEINTAKTESAGVSIAALSLIVRPEA